MPSVLPGSCSSAPLPWIALGAALGAVTGLSLGCPALANEADAWGVVYPPDGHQTTAEQIFIIGTAAPDQPLLLNGEALTSRSPAGHFAPSVPLQLGPNVITLEQGDQRLTLTVERLPLGPVLIDGLAPDTLVPAVDLERPPGERVCLSAGADPAATVSASLGDRTIPLSPPATAVQLPSNGAVLTGQPDPQPVAAVIHQGCFRPTQPGSLGQPTYTATLGGTTTTAVAPGTVTITAEMPLTVATVTATAGVARTGPSTAYSRLTPLPQGTQAEVTGRDGDWLRLAYGGWIRASETRLDQRSAPPHSLIRGVLARPRPGWSDLRFPLEVPVPVTLHQQPDQLTLTLHHTTPQTDTIFVQPDAVIERFHWQPVADGLQYHIHFTRPHPWGYTLTYEGTTLVLALRHPPAIRPPLPLAGSTIVVDPGHGGEELGARGPTGYPEKAVNLIVAQHLRQALETRGAQVIMLREGDEALGPNERADLINQLQPTLAISLHYNALPDAGDALNTAGIGAFWFHPQAQGLAQHLHDHLVTALDRPSYGVFWNNLALTRPHVAPSVLMELGFMINPTEFEWIVDPQAQRQLGESLAEGIETWVRQQGQSPAP